MAHEVIQDAAAREKLWQDCFVCLGLFVSLPVSRRSEEFVELTGAQWPESKAGVRTKEEGVLLA